MKPSFLTRYAGTSSLVIGFAYLLIVAKIWPSVTAYAFVPIAIAALLTRYYLATKIANHRQAKLDQMMRTQPCYTERLGLQALCHQLTAQTGNYSAKSASGHVTVDIVSLYGFVLSDAWQIDITACEHHHTNADGESVYEYTTTTYVLVPDMSTVSHSTGVTYQTTDQHIRDGKVTPGNEILLEYLDVTHHAFIRSALQQTESIAATKLR